MNFEPLLLVLACPSLFSRGIWCSLFLSLWGILVGFSNFSTAGFGFSFPLSALSLATVLTFQLLKYCCYGELKIFLMLLFLPFKKIQPQRAPAHQHSRCRSRGVIRGGAQGGHKAGGGRRYSVGMVTWPAP